MYFQIAVEHSRAGLLLPFFHSFHTNRFYDELIATCSLERVNFAREHTHGCKIVLELNVNSSQVLTTISTRQFDPHLMESLTIEEAIKAVLRSACKLCRSVSHLARDLMERVRIIEYVLHVIQTGDELQYVVVLKSGDNAGVTMR